MRQFVIGQIHGLAECAGSLRQHLETLAIEARIIGKLMGDAEERDFLHVDGGLAGVGERGAIEIAVANARELECVIRFDGANLGLGGPDVEGRRGGEGQGAEIEGEEADHSITLALFVG